MLFSSNRTNAQLDAKIAQETLSSIRTVISFGLHKLFIQKYSNNLKEAENISIKKGKK